MSVSVSMPQLGESVTEGTVTRWLKHEGDHVAADEPLLEVSTDKVDTEIPSPVSGILRGITVAEDETVEVGAELAVIDEDGAAPVAETAQAGAQQPAAQAQPYEPAAASAFGQAPYQAPYQQPPYERLPDAGTGYEAPPAYAEPIEPAPQQPAAYQPYAEGPGGYQVPPPPPSEPAAPPAPEARPAAPYQPAHAETAPPLAYPPPPPYEPAYAEPEPLTPADGAESPYVTPLVRKLAAEHDIDLRSITGTGVGGRIRKQDVLDAARLRRGGEPPRPAPGAAPPPAALASPPVAPAGPPVAPAGPAAVPGLPPAPGGQPAQAQAAQAAPRAIPAPSSQRGTTERLSRARQVIAARMLESLQTSAQLTTVIEADVTAIARLREQSKAAFEAREGVKLSFLPFFALATVEALKAHPKLNAVIDTANGTVTYHDAEHLGIAVDTERGLMVPVIRNAGDLNIGGLARKIADLAQRTRAGQVSPDDLTGGTFTLTNTGSRGALFDTPIINQPQVGILGTGTVNKRAVVVDDPDLGEVITVRSIVYLALTYDHRLVDGADAARFLVTIKNRLEEGAFDAELGR
jgi:pyruvate dehydrogenase E2 component (dihydrolipoamide acetyltransferase)